MKYLLLFALFAIAGAPTLLAQSASPTPAPDPLVGRWRWRVSHWPPGIVDVRADGTTKDLGNGKTGDWTLQSSTTQERKYAIVWDHGRNVDSIVLSTEGTTIDGQANAKALIKAERIAVPSSDSPALTNPLPAQQPGPTAGQPSAEAPLKNLTQLRQNYFGSLDALLRQSVRDNDQTAAAAITQELDKVSAAVAPTPSSTPAPATSPQTDPCGRWVWEHGSTTNLLNPDGTVGRPGRIRGSWHWVNQAACQLEIDWNGGYVDNLTITADGNSMFVTNNAGGSFSVRRLPSVEKAAVKP